MDNNLMNNLLFTTASSKTSAMLHFREISRYFIEIFEMLKMFYLKYLNNL